MSSRTPQLLIQTLNVNKNYQIKRYGQGRRRRPLWISIQLTVLLTLFIHMTFAKSLWKSELAELFRIPCSCRRSFVVIKGCDSFLSLNLYVIKMSLEYNLSFDLLSKCLLNLELIPSSQKQNNHGDIFRIQCIVFGHLWILITL